LSQCNLSKQLLDGRSIYQKKTEAVMGNFAAGWHLIYTMPNQEKKVADRLTERRIQSYLPLTVQKRQWHDRIKIVHAPVFPSYVFVYLSSLYDYCESMKTEGSCNYVKFGNRLARVTEQEIGNIRMVESKGANVEVLDKTFQIGQRLVIQQGPLTGLNCEVVDYKGKQRILVRVSMLQRSVLADLPFASVTDLL
jgi:transcriptional antiterminator RfaH